MPLSHAAAFAKRYTDAKKSLPGISAGSAFSSPFNIDLYLPHAAPNFSSRAADDLISKNKDTLQKSMDQLSALDLDSLSDTLGKLNGLDLDGLSETLKKLDEVDLDSLNDAIRKLSGIDLDSLNEAIVNLNDAVKPLADLARRLGG